MTQTRILRWLLIGLAIAVALGAYVFYVYGTSMAQTYPEFPNLRWLTIAALVGGLVLMGATFTVLFGLLGQADRGEAFSPRTVAMLGRLKIVLAAAAGFVTAATAAAYFWVEPHPALGIGWFVGEVGVLFLMTLAALLQRLFASAVQLRQEAELTV